MAYYGLFPESCYDAMDDVDFSFTETIYWRLSQQLHHRPLLGDHGLLGLQNAILQTITVVDNLPPVILTNLTTDTLDCNDPVIFEPSRLKNRAMAAGASSRTLVCDTAWVMRRRIGPKEIHHGLRRMWQLD